VRQAQQQAQAIVAAAAAEAAKISAQAERLSQEFVGRLSAVAGGDALDTPPPGSDDGSERVEAPPAQPSSP
jgi:regulator of protease activity HflC (stomatin/prohibitin superfamily)